MSNKNTNNKPVNKNAKKKFYNKKKKNVSVEPTFVDVIIRSEIKKNVTREMEFIEYDDATLMWMDKVWEGKTFGSMEQEINQTNIHTMIVDVWREDVFGGRTTLSLNDWMKSQN